MSPITEYRRLLRRPEWLALRKEILELDGSQCARCGVVRSKGMHVHHRQYEPGRKPWEYPLGSLETLCAGCHAAEHGKIVPLHDWVFVADDDLGDVSGACEFCDEPIRYVFTIHHATWGFLNVGTVCCDRMTGTREASELMRATSRMQRFISSPRWQRRPKSVYIRQNGFKIFIFAAGAGFRIRLSTYGRTLLGRRTYSSEVLAKCAVFDAIESGRAQSAFDLRSVLLPAYA